VRQRAGRPVADEIVGHQQLGHHPRRALRHARTLLDAAGAREREHGESEEPGGERVHTGRGAAVDAAREPQERRRSGDSGSAVVIAVDDTTG